MRACVQEESAAAASAAAEEARRAAEDLSDTRSKVLALEGEKRELQQEAKRLRALMEDLQVRGKASRIRHRGGNISRRS